MAKCNSPKDYLDSHHILTYLEDAVAQLLIYKDDNPKVDINRFFAEYFKYLQDGKHTLLREYSFVKATPYNRACFIRQFYDCFAIVGKKGDLLSIRDYYALVSMLCNDFPYEILQKTAKIVLIDDAFDCLISFTDFLYAFQLQLYYQEFLELSHGSYQALYESQSHSPRDIIVPTDHTTEHKNELKSTHTVTPSSGDGVDSTKFYRSLSQLSEKHKCCMPPLSVLKDVLTATDHVTFYGFLVALSKSEEINSSIGLIPSGDCLFDDVDLNLAEVAVEPTSQAKTSSKETSRPITPPVKKKEIRSTTRRHRFIRAGRRGRLESTDTDTSSESSDSDT